MNLSDDEIILRVQKGQVRDFEILIKRYQRPLIRFLHHFLGDFDEAESLAQDVFVRIFTRIDRYVPQNSFKSFLFTIARNLAINRLKKSRRATPLSHLFDPTTESTHFASLNTPDVEMEKTSRQNLISLALMGLPINQRLALVLKVYMQYSYQQIREVTGWSIPKTETLISRARHNMRKFVLAQETVRESVPILEE